MKGYPVTEDDLENLSWIDAAAGICFAIASGSASQWFGLTKDVALSSGASPEKIAYYSGISVAALVAAIVSFAAGVALLFLRRGKIRRIKDRTVFEDER